jgi:hypothetical protein
MSVEEHFRSVIEGAVERAVEGHSQEAIDRLVSSGGLGEVINETIPEVSAILANSLVEATPKMVAERRGVEATMAEEVRRAYGGGFDLCEAILWIASECGGEYVDQHFDLKEGVPVLWWVLGHLQARACRVAEEAEVGFEGHPTSSVARPAWIAPERWGKSLIECQLDGYPWPIG